MRGACRPGDREGRSPLRRRRLLGLRSPRRLLRGLLLSALCLRCCKHGRVRMALGHALRAAATLLQDLKRHPDLAERYEYALKQCALAIDTLGRRRHDGAGVRGHRV